MGSEEVIGAWLARFLRRRESGTTDAQEAQPDRAAAIGGLGEALVAERLRELGWPTLRNVVLRDRGGSTEIDLLARAPGVLMVLEVKTWSGRIEGAASAASWTRHGSDGRWVTVPNAVRQNLAHVGAVERAIGDSRVRVLGVVVSAGHARFAAPLRPHVVQVSAVNGVLRSLADGTRSGDQDRLDRAWALLSQEAARSPGRRAAHVDSLRSRHPGAGNCE
ncbi:MAG TPA: nuclease-related domain-containing protein [Candidatus Limnocylindria bacterium]|nr:nuclease-related domain-containing protein [Candidatus Limnocylindria bacterium]